VMPPWLKCNSIVAFPVYRSCSRPRM
jgi:hypothetical protein